MICPIDIRLNAAHPELPLLEAVTFTGSPSTVLIRGVPPNCGRWAITAVSVAATFPDGSTTTRAAVQSANGVWVATLPATATSGRTANGLRILADGIDENGAAVMGYILGVADFAVASLAVTPAPQPGETSWQMLYFDAAPSTLRKGDVTKVDGVLKFYNGSAWEPFAASVTLDGTVTRTSANGVKSSGIWSALWGALSALPTGFSSLYDWCVSQLAGKASTADATLTERGFREWSILHTPLTAEQKAAFYNESADAAQNDYAVSIGGSGPYALYVGAYNVGSLLASGDGDTVSFSVGSPEASTIWGPEGTVVATRTALQGYQLGSQSDKPLASEAEAEALRQDKQDALSAQQLANIAAVPNKLDKSGGTMTGAISFDDSMPSGGLCSVYYNADQWHLKDHIGTEIVTPKYAGGTVALTSAIPYSLVTKIITNGAVSLNDRASNAVTISTTLSPNTLTINFPTAATSGKVRDFAMRLNIAAGVTAPEIAWPQGVTLENDGGEVPEIADGGTGGSSTILYFSETENNGTTAKFLVKGETLTAITQA